MREIFIYGSCVTRDGVEWWPDYGFELDGYVARQSLISSQSKANATEAAFDFDRIDSSFQKRMAIGDLHGNLLSQINASAPNVIVWDLCDERNGVIRFESGNFLTRNILYKDAKMKGENLNFGTDEHFQLWAGALNAFLDQLEDVRVIVNATPWAIRNDRGEAVNGDDAKARAFNRNAVRYLDQLAARNLEIIVVPQDKAIALSSHKWGEAPFHYVDETYHVFLKQLKSLLG
jgi:hypothetical protein